MISGQTVIKMLDIIYISIIQFTLAIFMNIGVDKLFTPDREKLDEHTNVLQDFLLLCLMIAVLVTLSYIIRHIVRLIPSPFHTIQGFRHDTLPELTDIAPITGFVLLTSGYIENRIHHIRQYFNLKTAFMNIDKNKKEITANNK